MNKILVIIFAISVYFNIFLYDKLGKYITRKSIYCTISFYISGKLQEVYIKKNDYSGNVSQLDKIINGIELISTNSVQLKRDLLMMRIYKWRSKEKHGDKEGAKEDIKKIKVEMEKVYGEVYSDETIRRTIDKLYDRVQR